MSYPIHFTPTAAAPPALKATIIEPVADNGWLEAISDYLEGADVAVDDPACSRENYAYFEESR